MSASVLLAADLPSAPLRGFYTMEKADWLTFQNLTKRSARMRGDVNRLRG